MVFALLYLMASFFCFAVVLLLWVRKRQEIAYLYFAWLLKRNYRVLLKCKSLLFLCRDKQSLELAEHVINLTKETSLLLYDWKKYPMGDFSKQQVWACLDECSRVNKVLYKGLRQQALGRLSEKGFYTKRKRGFLRASCYFCSQPTLFYWFGRSKAIVQEKTLSVTSCPTCRQTLKKFKKINVLYFFYGKNKVHWSECRNYKPKFSYWSMNRMVEAKKERKRSLLRLVINNNKNRLLR